MKDTMMVAKKAKKAVGKAIRKNSVQKNLKVKKTMGEFKAGTLHSGSKNGPKVTNRKQAIAIALNQGGL